MVLPELTRQSIQRRLGSFTTSASRVWYPATASVWAASLWRRVASCCAALRARRRSSAALCSSRAARSDFCGQLQRWECRKAGRPGTLVLSHRSSLPDGTLPSIRTATGQCCLQKRVCRHRLRCSSTAAYLLQAAHMHSCRAATSHKIALW